jgi:hypothetical protein
MDRRRSVGVALVLVSAAAFGSGSLFAQPVYAAGVGWLTLSAWRFLFGAGFTWCFLLLSADRRASLREAPVILSETMIFPYLRGLVFCARLTNDGGWSELVLHPRRLDLIVKHLRPLNEDDRPARNDARGDPDAGQALHASSPKPDSTSAASAATASPSSVPSAEIVIVDPRAAASSRMPMMLLPSTRRASRAT